MPKSTATKLRELAKDCEGDSTLSSFVHQLEFIATEDERVVPHKGEPLDIIIIKGQPTVTVNGGQHPINHEGWLLVQGRGHLDDTMLTLDTRTRVV